MQTTNSEEIEKTLKEEAMLRITPEEESPHYCTKCKDILSGISQIIKFFVKIKLCIKMESKVTDINYFVAEKLTVGKEIKKIVRDEKMKYMIRKCQYDDSQAILDVK